MKKTAVRNTIIKLLKGKLGSILNEKKNTTYQNLCNVTAATFAEKFTALSGHTRKEKMTSAQ